LLDLLSRYDTTSLLQKGPEGSISDISVRKSKIHYESYLQQVVLTFVSEQISKRYCSDNDFMNIKKQFNKRNEAIKYI